MDLNSLMRIRDGNNSDPGWKKVGSGINIPAGSTTLVPDLAHQNHPDFDPKLRL
jgi:hypothetical protein